MIHYCLSYFVSSGAISNVHLTMNFFFLICSIKICNEYYQIYFSCTQFMPASRALVNNKLSLPVLVKQSAGCSDAGSHENLFNS